MGQIVINPAIRTQANTFTEQNTFEKKTTFKEPAAGGSAVDVTGDPSGSGPKITLWQLAKEGSIFFNGSGDLVISAEHDIVLTPHTGPSGNTKINGPLYIIQQGGTPGTDQTEITFNGTHSIYTNRDTGVADNGHQFYRGSVLLFQARTAGSGNGFLTVFTGGTGERAGLYGGDDAPTARMVLDGPGSIVWSSTTDITMSGLRDTGLKRGAAGGVQPTDGNAGGAGYFILKQRAAPSVVTDAALLYAKDTAGTAEMFVRDEAGTETQISPHAMDGPATMYDDTDPLPHVVKEHNVYLAGVRYVNLSRTAMLVEELLKAIAQGRTLTQIATVLNNKGPGFIDCYKVETFAAHNARLGLTGAQALVQRSWSADQNALQTVYDADRLREQTLRDQWDALRLEWLEWNAADPETRGDPPDLPLGPEPVVRPVADVRLPMPGWLSSRGGGA